MPLHCSRVTRQRPQWLLLAPVVPTDAQLNDRLRQTGKVSNDLRSSNLAETIIFRTTSPPPLQLSAMRLVIAIPAILALIARAASSNSLTRGGLVAALLTAIAHAYHPWNLPFALLAVFFLAGTRVTHVSYSFVLCDRS